MSVQGLPQTEHKSFGHPHQTRGLSARSQWWSSIGTAPATTQRRGHEQRG